MARSTVIKSGTGQRVEPVGLRAFRIDDVLREAQARVEAAQARAEQIVQEAQSQAQAIRDSARQEGHQAGHAEGTQKGQQAGRAEALAAAKKEFAEQQKQIVSTCKSLIAGIQADRSAWQAAARQDLVELAMAIARRVAPHVGERERDAVLANLEEAVRLAGARSEVTVLVNPKDAEAARVFADSLLEMKEQWSEVRVVEETEISPGGCRVQWGSGTVDATIETQLDRIAEALGCNPSKTES